MNIEKLYYTHCVLTVQCFLLHTRCPSTKTHVPIHFQTTTVVHGLLLALELTHLFANGITLGNRTVSFFAVLGMNAKQGPNALANFAATSGLDATDTGMMEIALHLLAIR